ncbi:hypothetical protein SNF32_02365 [Enterococcus mundtii]|nr:hypothetical protein [Enterococcus mundtii]
MPAVKSRCVLNTLLSLFAFSLTTLWSLLISFSIEKLMSVALLRAKSRFVR